MGVHSILGRFTALCKMRLSPFRKSACVLVAKRVRLLVEYYVNALVHTCYFIVILGLRTIRGMTMLSWGKTVEL